MRGRLFHDDVSYDDSATHSVGNRSNASDYEAQLVSILKDYRRVYIDPNILFLVNATGSSNVANFLSHASRMDVSQFADLIQRNYPDTNDKSKRINAIYGVLHLMMCGQLTRENMLMTNLRHAFPSMSEENINGMVKKHVTIEFITRNGDYGHASKSTSNDPGATPTKRYY
jgi:hypothetical protein